MNDNTEEQHEQQSTSKKRFSTKSFAITSWTNVSSKSIGENIRKNSHTLL
jgi:hypothetical protein